MTTFNKFVDNSFLNDKGFATNNIFKIIFSKPPESLTSVGFLKKLEENYIEASIPDRNLSVFRSPFSYGVNSEARDTFDVTFYENSDFEVRKFFQEWIDLIRTDYHTGGKLNRQYYDDYITNLSIQPFKKENVRSEQIFNFVDVFPKGIGGPTFNAEGSHSIDKVKITFQFRYYRMGTTITKSARRPN